MIGTVTKVLVGLLAVGGVGSAAVWAAAGPPDERAVVAGLVDGDTFVAGIGGRTETIRLLNIDAPDPPAPDMPAQCLGPEAATLLASMIPIGSTVTLQYDDKHLDRYGRTLAGVIMPNGALLNAEIARAGLGTAVVFDGDDRFLQPVQAAQQDAAQHLRGLYSTDVPCTLPAQVDAVTSAVAQGPAVAQQASSTAELDAAATGLAGLAGRASALADVFVADRTGPMFAVLARDEQDELARRLVSARDTAREGEATLRTAAEASRTRDIARSGRRGRRTLPVPTHVTAEPQRLTGTGATGGP